MKRAGCSRGLAGLILCGVVTLMAGSAQASEDLLEKPRRILVLGDSITYGGGYVVGFEAWLEKRFPQRQCIVYNAGVPSETVSGLSEDGHAGGRFPRPVLSERLERVLELTKPELIIACYGMNCGIYLPLDDERFARFKEGVVALRTAAARHHAQIVHVTPPFYDNHGNEELIYDEVLTAYAAWLVGQRQEGWHVADLHTPMKAEVMKRRQSEPNFTFQKDKVHPNEAGHWLMARCLIRYFGGEAQGNSPADLLDAKKVAAIGKRSQLRRNAIHHETKPIRPGLAKGTTLAEAEKVVAGEE